MKLALLLTSVVAFGQTFEVATVKPAAPSGRLAGLPAALLEGPDGDRIRFGGGPGSSTPTRIDYVGVTLKSLVQRAYDLKPEQVSGLSARDGWYDIAATMAPGTTEEQLRLMLRQLLAERFQLSLHREKKTMRVYLLTVAKGGSKLKPPVTRREYANDEEGKEARRKDMIEGLKAAGARSQRSGPFQTWSMGSATLAKFAQELSSRVDRPVIDRTGLEGLYSFALDWVPDGAKPREGIPLSGPSIYAAVEEQLGLHLEPATQEAEILVIDSVEMVPTAN